MKRIKSVLRSSTAQEIMYKLALLNTGQDSVHKMDFTDIIDLFTAVKTRKDCFKCFVLRICNFGFRFHLFLYEKFFCCHFNLKNIPFPILPTFAFSKVIYEYKAKVSSRTGCVSQVRQSPCGLNPALLGGDSSKCRIPPSPSLLPCSEDHHLPLSDCEFSVIY